MVLAIRSPGSGPDSALCRSNPERATVRHGDYSPMWNGIVAGSSPGTIANGLATRQYRSARLLLSFVLWTGDPGCEDSRPERDFLRGILSLSDLIGPTFTR